MGWGYAWYGAIYGIAGISGPLLGAALSSKYVTEKLTPELLRRLNSEYFQRFLYKFPYFFVGVFMASFALFSLFLTVRYLEETRKPLTHSSIPTEEPSDFAFIESVRKSSFNDIPDISIEDDVRNSPRPSDEKGEVMGLPFASMLPIALYCLIAMVNLMFMTALPLFLSSGLGYSPASTSSTITMIAFSKFVIQILFYQWFINRFGIIGSYKVGMFLLVPCALVLLPLSHLSSSLQYVALLLVLSVIGLSEALSYLSVIMLITKSVGPDRLGRVHGVAATFAAAVRTVAPAMAGTLWEWGRGWFPSLVFWVISVFSLGAILLARKYKAVASPQD